MASLLGNNDVAGELCPRLVVDNPMGTGYKIDTTVWYITASDAFPKEKSFKRGAECGYFQKADELPMDEDSMI